ncbi:hypothetical protein HMSSN139_32600 [Paenibacillus sp. HMSSN-139]|nr:hypothetical protein HMSSN139_32600 [Paenibacillus sp. HMSSN-139]
MFKIYIVEDDKPLVELLEQYLHRFGYDTLAVADFGEVKPNLSVMPRISCCWT